MDENLKKQVDAAEATGKTRYGDDWTTAMGVLRDGIPGGIPEANMKEVLKAPDPAGVLYNAAKEMLIAKADEGDRTAESMYSEIRHREREAYRRSRGRA